MASYRLPDIYKYSSENRLKGHKKKMCERDRQKDRERGEALTVGLALLSEG